MDYLLNLDLKLHNSDELQTKKIMLKTFFAILTLGFLITGCAGPYSIGYPINTLGGSEIRYETPVQIRTFADRRPYFERHQPDAVTNYTFYSSDNVFNEPVAVGITRAMLLELANSGIEVSDSKNYIVGNKPYLRVSGDILHYNISRKDMLEDAPGIGKNTLWLPEQYTVNVSIRIKVVDGKTRKLNMQRVYNSCDTVVLRSKMMDYKAYKENPKESLKWKKAGDDYYIRILNDHLKYVLANARNDIIKQLKKKQKLRN